MYHSFSRLSTLNNPVSLRQIGGHLTICLRYLRLLRLSTFSLFQALRQWGRRESEKHATPPSQLFVFALSLFSGPEYLGAQNRLFHVLQKMYVFQLPAPDAVKRGWRSTLNYLNVIPPYRPVEIYPLTHGHPPTVPVVVFPAIIESLEFKGDVTRDVSQRPFLAQQRVATLFRMITTLFQHCNAVLH